MRLSSSAMLASGACADCASVSRRQVNGGTMRRGIRLRPASGAFTLIELLTVLAITGILSAIVIGMGQRASEAGKAARAKAELSVLTAALETYKRQFGDYPQTSNAAELLQSLIGKRGPRGANVTGRSLIDLVHFATANGADPFQTSQAELIDPWERSYVYAYRVPSTVWTNPGYVLYSAGPDTVHDAGLLTGGFANTAVRQNVDNLYAR